MNINTISRRHLSQQITSTQQQKKLVQQIQEYKDKIAKYKALQSEIEIVNSLIKNQQSKTKKQISDSSDRLTYKQKPRRSSKTNLKIKAYEVHKKLTIKQKQYRQKQAKNLTLLQEDEQLLLSIQDMHALIANQDRIKERITKQRRNSKLNSEAIQNKIEEVKKLIEEQQEIYKMYQLEKYQKIDHIKMMKKQLQISSGKTEPDDQSLSYVPEFGRPINTHPIVDPVLIKEDQSEQNLLLDDLQSYRKKSEGSQQLVLSPETSRIHEQNSKNWVNQSPFNNHGSFRGKDSPSAKLSKRLFSPHSQYEHFSFCQENTNLNGQDKSSIFGYQPAHNVFSHLDKINSKLVTKLKQEQNKTALLIKENLLMEHLLVHKVMTIKLLKNKVNHHQHIIDSQEEFLKLIFCKKGKMEILNEGLGNLTGQLGSLRGKVGVKVENRKIVTTLNKEIEQQLQKIFNLHEQLQQLHQEAQQIQ